MRPRTDDTMMAIAKVMAQRSTCLRNKVGAVLAQGAYILATGYNGAPRHMKHCEVAGCIRDKDHVPSGMRTEYCRGSHAEINALLQAANRGVAVGTPGLELYTTHSPCCNCAKALINMGVQYVVMELDYPDELAKKLLKEAGVGVIRYENREQS